jgi:hypothetical protein
MVRSDQRESMTDHQQKLAADELVALCWQLLFVSLFASSLPAPADLSQSWT